jgi:hypothetical protein
MDVVSEFAEVDRLVDRYGEELGSRRDAYRNHIYRVLNFTLFLNDGLDADMGALEVAGFFHDLDFVLHGNGAYLEPSSEAARDYLDETDRVTLKPLVTDLIVCHHKLTQYCGEHGPLVEYFRRADSIDLTLGIIRPGVSGPFIRSVKEAFPNAGFHKLLVKNLVLYAFRHPLKPFPMMRK